MDWKKISPNPNHPQVRVVLESHLKQKQIPAIYDRNYYFAQWARGKSVLDIGIVGQSLQYWTSPAWLHRYIHEAASSCIGIDTNEQGVKLLRERGYDAQLIDATSKVFLGKTFDVIVAGEFLEHISQFEDFFCFCSRHANNQTHLLLSSPNPHYIEHICRILGKGMFLSNAEHVAWISPTHILELCRRTAWSLVSYTSNTSVTPRPRPA